MVFIGTVALVGFNFWSTVVCCYDTGRRFSVVLLLVYGSVVWCGILKNKSGGGAILVSVVCVCSGLE